MGGNDGRMEAGRGGSDGGTWQVAQGLAKASRRDLDNHLQSLLKT